MNDNIKVVTTLHHKIRKPSIHKLIDKPEAPIKVIKVALTKVVNANRIDWDIKLHAM